MVSCGYFSGCSIASSSVSLREHVEVHVEAALAEIHVEGLHGVVDRRPRRRAAARLGAMLTV